MTEQFFHDAVKGILLGYLILFIGLAALVVKIKQEINKKGE